MSPQEDAKSVPVPTLRRLPRYAEFLKRVQARGRAVISCSHIGREFNLDPTQVRKDLAITGATGRPKVGYDVPALLTAIRDFLGWNNERDAFLVGAGSLGTALLGYDRFDQYGVNIVAAFDTAPDKVGGTVHGKEVLDLEKMSDLAQRMNVHIGIIAVPEEAAQSVANLLVLSGIRAIWNFASTALDVPDNVIVQNEDLFSSLAILSSKLAATLRAEP